MAMKFIFRRFTSRLFYFAARLQNLFSGAGLLAPSRPAAQRRLTASGTEISNAEAIKPSEAPHQFRRTP
jgi:hypothetical protein